MTTEELRESLLMESKNGYTLLSSEQRDEMNAYAKRYMAFMNACKTEREATAWAVEKSRKPGLQALRPRHVHSPRRQNLL